MQKEDFEQFSPKELNKSRQAEKRGRLDWDAYLEKDNLIVLFCEEFGRKDQHSTRNSTGFQIHRNFIGF